VINMYTLLGRVVAFLALAGGAMTVAMGVYVAYAFDGHPEAISRYLGSVANTGEAIDRGIFYVVISIGFGLVVEISRSLKRIADQSDFEFEEDE